MILCIAGSRSIKDAALVGDALAASGWVQNASLVIHGACDTGVDAIADKLLRGTVPIQTYPANWTKYGRSAGPLRNKVMAGIADMLLLIWDGRSPGSRSMLSEMRKLGKPVHEVIVGDKGKRSNKPVDFPGVVVIDTREQLPMAFQGLRADAKDGGGPLVVRTKAGTLQSGDYSLEGYESRVAVERKSLADLFGTVGRGRERFERELARLDEMDFAAVVVEAEWSQVFDNPPPHSQLTPKTVFRSVGAWEQRYPRVHWHFLPGRDFAEVKVFRVLERFLKTIHTGERQP